ncbi:MAG: DUF882 domain-containing protein [Polyangiales bacterium]
MSPTFVIRASSFMVAVAACSQLIAAPAVLAESRALVPSAEIEVEEALLKSVDDGSQRPRHDAHAAASKPAPRSKKSKPALTPDASPDFDRNAKQHRRAERQPTAEYRRIRDSWHAPIAAVPLADLEPGKPRPLVLAPVNGGERVMVTPDRDDGGFSEAELLRAARALTPGRPTPHPIAPHLLDLVYRAMRHFDAPLVHVISGYRADRAGSRHTQGRAIDMVLPGVSNEQLARYLRDLGFVGVGTYPKSGFVHLDVRDASFFWVDNSLPGERCKVVPVLSETAAKADERARARGEQPDMFVPNNDREDRAAARAYKRRTQQRNRPVAAPAATELATKP